METLHEIEIFQATNTTKYLILFHFDGFPKTNNKPQHNDMPPTMELKTYCILVRKNMKMQLGSFDSWFKGPEEEGHSRVHSLFQIPVCYINKGNLFFQLKIVISNMVRKAFLLLNIIIISFKTPFIHSLTGRKTKLEIKEEQVKKLKNK